MKYTGKEIAQDRAARRKKITDAPVSVSERVPTVRIDAHLKQLKGLSVGDKVTVVLTGNITSLEVNSYDTCFGMDILSSDIKDTGSAIAKLADDNDED